MALEQQLYALSKTFTDPPAQGWLLDPFVVSIGVPSARAPWLRSLRDVATGAAIDAALEGREAEYQRMRDLLDPGTSPAVSPHQRGP